MSFQLGPRLYSMVVLSGSSKECISLGLSSQSHCLMLDFRICCRKHLNVTYTLVSFCAVDFHFSCLNKRRVLSLCLVCFYLNSVSNKEFSCLTLKSALGIFYQNSFAFAS